MFVDYPLAERADLILGADPGLASVRVRTKGLPSTSDDVAFGHNAGIGVGLAVGDRAAIDVLYRYMGVQALDGDADQSPGVEAHVATAGPRFGF